MSISACVVKSRVRGFVWFGSLSYRRLHITYESRKLLCPLCKHELQPARYFGSKVFQHDPVKSDYKTNFWMPLKENGEIVWFLAPDLEKRIHDWWWR
jgi:hypothetical protein